MEKEEIMLMDLRHVIGLAAAVRDAQKTYFKGKKEADLLVSKRLETALDLWLAEKSRTYGSQHPQNSC